jgi:hypothetical protein
MTQIQLARYVLPLVLLLPGVVRADEPKPGTVRTLPVVSVSMSVGSTERESKRVVYAPPPGWYVRSHRIQCVNRRGEVSYAVNTVPAGWNWHSDERSRAASKSSADVMLATFQTWAGGRAAASKDASSADRQTNTSSHHLLVVDVTAKGEGFFGGGGGVELTVYADMVYLGNDHTLAAATPEIVAAK